MWRLLARTAVAARVAHRITGVPASLLIAESFEVSGWVAAPYGHFRNDFFNTGESFPSPESAFLAHAFVLSKDRRVQAVIRAASEPVTDDVELRCAAAFNRVPTNQKYLNEISSCEFWKKETRDAIATCIAGYELQECDVFEPSSFGDGTASDD